MASINRGDNTGAFGCNFLKIYLNNPNNLYIQKAVFQINGNLEKEFIDPKFPLKINFTGEETELLCQVNHCKLALWDESGRRRTAEGKFTFFVKENNIKSPDTPDYVYDDVEEDNSICFDLEDAEFAAEFVVNATPSKLSEIQIDVPILTADNIIDGRNIHTFVDENGNLVISADLDTEVDWSNITGKPTINGMPLEGNVEIHFEGDIPNADWNATEGPAEILNKPKFAQVAYTGNYNDIVGAPKPITKVSQLENDAGYLNNISLDDYYTKEQTEDLIQNNPQINLINGRIDNLEQEHGHDVNLLDAKIDTKLDAQTYNDEIILKADTQYVNDKLAQKLDSRLLGKGNLSISQNNVLLNTFSANAQTDMSINIDVPEKVSQLQNDLNFITAEQVDLNNFVTKTEYDNDKKDNATIDDIGTGILTILSNYNPIGTFNANSKQNKSINLTIPEKLSDLNNDIDLVTQDDLTNINENIENIQANLDEIPNELDALQVQVDNKVTIEPGKTLISQAEIDRLSQLHDYDDTEVRSLIDKNAADIEQINSTLPNKVDVETGKGLSTNDYTTEDKNTLQETYETSIKNQSAITRLDSRVTVNENTLTQHTSDLNKLNTNLSNEAQQRQDKDNELQEQIEALTAKSSVADIVATDHDLSIYDTSKLKTGDVICVIKDEAHADTTSYYRWDGSTFLFVGSEGEYYTKSTADNIFVRKSQTINGHALQQDLVLTPQDIKALPDTTVIGDGIVTIQKNGETITTFSLNQVENRAVNIEIPVNTSDLNNDEQFVTRDVMFSYIGDVPEDNNLQDQVDAANEAIDHNSTRIDTLQNLITGSLEGLPEVALTGSYNDLKDKPTIPDKVSQLENDLGYITSAEVEAGYVKPEDLPTKVSQFENDRGYVTNNAIGRGILTLQINSHEVGTWMANEKDNFTWNIPVDGELSTTSTLPVENNIITNEVIRVDESAVHKTGNETVNDTKTFENVILQKGTAPTMPTEDNSTNIATTAYVKNQDYCTNTEAVHKAGTETITGNKTFTGDVSLNTATGVTLEPADNSKNLATTEYVKSQDYCTNSEAVHKFGDEVIQGDKTFNDTTTFVGITQLSRYTHVPTPVENNPELDFIDLVVNIEFVNNKIQTVNDRIDNEVQTLNTTITNNIQTVNNTISSVQTTLQNNINNLTQTVTTNKNELDADIMSINGQISTINSNINTINTNITEINETHYTKQETYTQQEVDNLLTQRDNTISQLQQLITQMQTQITSLEERITALEPTEEP